jgi:hypothetical protein
MADFAANQASRALQLRAKGLELTQIAKRLGCTLRWVKAAIDQASDAAAADAAERAAEIQERRMAKFVEEDRKGQAHQQLLQARLRREVEYARSIRLELWFPPNGIPFTPESECPHRGPIREGSWMCCAVCHRTGIDDHPAFRRDPATEPRPELKPIGPPAHEETRREKRERLYQNLMANRSARTA